MSVALITGGGNGIGAAAARRLADAGTRVAVADVDEAAAAGIADEIGGISVRCDVSSRTDMQAAVAAALDAFGSLDVALLNAGVGGHAQPGDDFDVDAYRRVMAVNVDGVVFGIDAVVPALRDGGRIVVTASLAGLAPLPSAPIYTASKHAVVGLVRALAPKLAERGVAINAVCPGFTDTGLVDPLREELETPLLKADDVAAAVCAVLASDGTGQAWFVQPGRPTEPFVFRNVPGPR